MKVIAFNGSGRKDGNTAILINYVLKELEKEGLFKLPLPIGKIFPCNYRTKPERVAHWSSDTKINIPISIIPFGIILSCIKRATQNFDSRH